MNADFGLVLPHFGDVATADRVLGAAASLESAGLDSLWFRDHLAFAPHDYEPPGTRFLDPFTFLGAIGRATATIRLGTATLIPFRHPLIVSQLLGGIEELSGGRRLIVGVGAGGVREPFEATGVPFERRFAIIDEWVSALRASWTSVPTTWQGDEFTFEGVTIDPRPDPATPIWYGGSSLASVRRAVRLADGWLPGRCPVGTLDDLLPVLREEGAAAGKDLDAGLMPLLVLGDSREDALGRCDLGPVLAMARSNPRWTGTFDGVDDLEGLLVAGSPTDCLEQLDRLVARGLNHVVFDLRLVQDEVDEQLARLVEELLPALLSTR